jgi:hypothetical protein
VANRQRRSERRLDKSNLRGCSEPMMTARNLHYEVAERTRGIAAAGLGARHLLVRRRDLAAAIDRRREVLKIHLPYHESDHVLALAYLPLWGGTCLQDLELLRQEEVVLEALGARRRPDPTTAGAFCRRFSRDPIQTLLDLFDDTRRRVCAAQPAAFCAQARVDRDGFLVETTGQWKQGRDIASDGTWGYHALVLTLANTGEVLSLGNRSGNRPSAEGAAAQGDRALPTGFRGGFRPVLLRGDTTFSPTEHRDRWDDDPRVRVRFGFEAHANLQAIADNVPAHAWKPLQRSPRYPVKTQPRARPDNVQEAVVVARQFEKQRLRSEEVAAFNYRPTACQQTCRRVVVNKTRAVAKGQQVLLDKVVYCFDRTNDWVSEAAAVVFAANDRGAQEHLLAQLSGGVRALRAPVDNLESNGAYLVRTARAWNLKAWWGLLLPERPGRWPSKQEAEKRWGLGVACTTFIKAFVRLPCQVIGTGRQRVSRLLGWNGYQPICFRLLDVWRC